MTGPWIEWGAFPSRFRITRRLGEGAHGEVWAATDAELQTAVALKVLKRSEGAALRRFKTEFRTLATLSHPNLVTLHELFELDGRWVLVMDFVDGDDFMAHVAPGVSGGARTQATDIDRATHPPTGSTALHATTRENPSSRAIGPADLQRLIDALIQLTGALRVLHDRDVLHCDVKPSNVLVRRSDERVVLLDFGLAEDRRLATERRHHLGTPAYMSPEQAAGGELGPATDWYSVGVMLFEALTGRLPFFGQTRQILAAKQGLDRVRLPPSAEVPAPLRSLCEQLLARDAASRPDGAQVHRMLVALADRATQTRETYTPKHSTSAVQLVEPIGRRKPIAVLRDAVEAVSSGPVVAFVRGDAGIGKSTLVRSFVESLDRSRVAVFDGRCFRQAVVSFKALDEVVDRMCDELLAGSAAGTPLAPSPGLEAISHVFPVLRQLWPSEVASGQRRLPVDMRLLAARGLAELLVLASNGRPIVLSIDDVHWGDRDSASLLTDVLSREASLPVLLIACHRPQDEGRDGLPARLRSLAVSAGASVVDIDVDPLNVDDARAVVASTLSADLVDVEEISAVLAAESRGIPFIALELARRLHERHGTEATAAVAGALRFVDVVGERVGAVSEHARRLLAVISVANRPLESDVARRIADLGPNTWPAMRELLEGTMIRAESGRATNEQRFDTFHHCIRDVVLSGLPAEELRMWHGALATELSRYRLSSGEEVAHHYRAAGDIASAAHHAERGADAALAALAFDRASALYALALESPHADRAMLESLRRRRAEALACAGRGAEAAREYRNIAGHAVGLDRVELEMLAGEQLLRAGQIGPGLAAMTSVYESFGERIPVSAAAAVPSLLGLRARLRLASRLVARHRPRRRYDRKSLLRVDAALSSSSGLALVDPIRSAAIHTRGVLLAMELGEPTRLARALCGEVLYSGMGGAASRRRTERLVHAAQAVAVTGADPLVGWLASACTGIAAVQEGRFDDGVRICTESLEDIISIRRSSYERMLVEHFYGFALYYTGALGRLCSWVPVRLREADMCGDLNAATDLSTQYPNLVWLLAVGADEARARVHGAMATWPSTGFWAQHYYSLLALANIELFEGNAEAAWNEVRTQWPAWRRSLLGFAQGMRVDALELRARVGLARAAQAPNSWARRLRCEQARVFALQLRLVRAPWANALGMFRLAGVCAIGGDSQAAATKLRRSIELLDRVGLRLHAACARERLAGRVGSDEGATLRRAADAYFQAEHVADRAGLVRMIAPE